MSGGNASSTLLDKTLLIGGKIYLLRYLGVRRVLGWCNHLASVDVRVLLANVDGSKLRKVESENSYRFEWNVSVPSYFPSLPFLGKNSFVELLELAITYDADLVIPYAVIIARINDRMDMQLGRRWLARKLTQALGELFLEGVIQSVLSTEKDDTTLGD